MITSDEERCVTSTSILIILNAYIWHHRVNLFTTAIGSIRVQLDENLIHYYQRLRVSSMDLM